jgi:hypothetical protein
MEYQKDVAGGRRRTKSAAFVSLIFRVWGLPVTRARISTAPAQAMQRSP